MRILIACDKFKGSLAAPEVARVLRETLAPLLPAATFDLCPIADGGEGTTEAMVGALGGVWRETEVTDARGRLVAARHGYVPTRRLAILEMSAASGLSLVRDLPLAPSNASTAGTGELLLAAAREADEIVLGIGGSATNDGGLGLAVALGWQARRADGSLFRPTLADITEAVALVPGKAALPRIRVACDVDNPLLGPNGATRVYGPQKGVADFAWFERRLAHLADLARDLTGADRRDVPGAGAAGGLGFGLMTFAGAELVPGFDLVARTLGREARGRAADRGLTGEGRIDRQSHSGKGPVGLARLARRLGKPVVAFAGSVEDDPAVADAFNLLTAISPSDLPVAEAMRRAGELLAQAARKHAATIGQLAARPAR